MVAKATDVKEQEPKELTPEQKAIAEMVAPTDEKIRSIVERIEIVKAEIAELAESSGIATREAEIKRLRENLFEMVERRYEIAGENNPLAYYVKEGERISFDAAAVDKGLSTLLDLRGQMSTLVKDTPVKRFRVTVNGEAGMATAQDMIEVSGSEGMAETPYYYLCVVLGSTILASNWIRPGAGNIEGTSDYDQWLRANAREMGYRIDLHVDGGMIYAAHLLESEG